MSDVLTAEEAVEQLFEMYADDIYRFARYTLHNEVDAKDVVQEVFLRAFRAWNEFRQESGAKTWLFHIARNYIHDMMRKRRTEWNYHQKNRPATSDLSVSLDTIVELEDALKQLKPEYRQVFVMRCIEDLSVEETATVLRCSPGKVKTTLHRAVRKLREILNDDGSPQQDAERRKDGGMR